MSHARGSLVEIETQLLIAEDLGYVPSAKGNALLRQAAELGRILNGLIYKRIYKRICQEHCSPFAGCAGLFRDIQPLSPWKTLVWCPAPGLFHRSSCIFFSSDDAGQFRNAFKPCGCMVATMDLSEALGLVLFRVVRRGIGITRRLSVSDTCAAYRPLGCSPSNPSVSRTNRPPPEKEAGGDGKGSSPETLKRLVLLVSQRRSFLLSSTGSR
ncbi:MAG TPA: four helix bundle protein [Terriglobales bacterium]|nr:four helix bundle protein [Terriglobales bacterium]